MDLVEDHGGQHPVAQVVGLDPSGWRRATSSTAPFSKLRWRSSIRPSVKKSSAASSGRVPRHSWIGDGGAPRGVVGFTSRNSAPPIDTRRGGGCPADTIRSSPLRASARATSRVTIRSNSRSSQPWRSISMKCPGPVAWLARTRTAVRTLPMIGGRLHVVAGDVTDHDVHGVGTGP